MANKPTIVLVHGFWGGAAHWSKVIVQLARLGYDSIFAVENPLTSLAGDAARTKKMIAQQKGPVLLVGHSYGGAVITEAGISRMSSDWSISQHSPPGLAKTCWMSGKPSLPGGCQCGTRQQWVCLDQPKEIPRELLSGSDTRRGTSDGRHPTGARWKHVRRQGHRSSVEEQAVVVPDLQRGSNDRARKRKAHGGKNGCQENNYACRQSRVPCLGPHSSECVDR
jgi:hypothetical protein